MPNGFSNGLWPTITDTETARKATRQGFWVAIVITALTVVIAFLSTAVPQLQSTGFDLSILVDAAAFALVAWGIHRLSRIAAVGGLCLYIFERIFMWATMGPGNPILPVLFTLTFINAVRGTFAFHRFNRISEPTGLQSPTA
jgi:hypothetical protein